MRGLIILNIYVPFKSKNLLLTQFYLLFSTWLWTVHLYCPIFHEQSQYASQIKSEIHKQGPSFTVQYGYAPWYPILPYPGGLRKKKEKKIRLKRPKAEPTWFSARGWVYLPDRNQLPDRTRLDPWLMHFINIFFDISGLIYSWNILATYMLMGFFTYFILNKDINTGLYR